MAEDVAAADNAVHNGADDRTLLDDLTVLAQPVGAAPQSGEARQAQDSDRGGGIAELAAVHQGTPDLAARFIPAAPDLAGAKDAGDLGKGPGVAANGAIDSIDNAKPVGPENTPRADGSEGNSALTLPQNDGGRQTGGAVANAPAAEDVLRHDPAAPHVDAPVAPAAATAGAAAPVAPDVPETKATTVKPTDTIVQPDHAGTPGISVTAASGEEDNAIALNVKIATTDTGDTISNITITGVPSGATLNHGTHNADGSWTLTTDQLDGLTLTPPLNFGGTIELTVAATAIDGTATASTSALLDVSVLRVADKPMLTASDTVTAEDTSVALTIAPHLTDTDGSEAITAITITGVPTGASLNHGTHNTDGSWTLTQADLAGLKITPASHDAHDFTLTITTTSTEMASDPNPIAAGKASAVSDPVTLHVTVDGVATTTLVHSSTAAGVEDTRINLNLSLTHTDAGETLSASLAGIPSGSHFYDSASGGSAIGHDNGNGTWSFSAADIAKAQAAGSGVFIQPPQDWNDFNSASQGGIQVVATLTANQIDPETGAVTPLVTTQNFAVHVAGVADKPTVTASDATTTEDTSVALTITPHLTDVTNTEVISAVTITGVPGGASLNHGTHNADGSWTLTTGDLAGLRLTPASHDAHDFTLTITTTSTEQGSNISVLNAVSDPVTLHVAVDGVATTTLVHSSTAAGVEDTRINLNLSLTHTDAGETLSASLAGIPAGSHFYDSVSGGSAIGHDNGNGTWSFSADDIAKVQAGGMFLQPPQDWNDFNSAGQGGIQVAATLTANQIDPDSGAVTPLVTTQNFAVHVAGVADKPNVTASDATTTEDTSVALTITPHLTDVTNTEVISAVTITGVPGGASLNHGTHNADGSWTLTTGDLAGLRLTPASHDAHDFTLTITTTSTEQGSNISVLNAVSDPVTLHVAVAGVDQAPVITQTVAASGVEDTRIAVNLNLGVFKADESLTGLTVTTQAGSDAANASALAGSTFSTGDRASVGSYDSAHGSWSFTTDEVADIKAHGLYVQTPRDWNDDVSAGHNTGLALTATVASHEIDPDSGAVTTASTPLNVAVHVAGVADKPTVTAAAAEGNEDSAIPLTITPYLTDITNTEVISAVTITGVPSTASLNHGTHNADGSWTLTSAQLSGLTITPPSHSAVDFTLTITTTSTEQGSNISVLNAVSDPVTLHVAVDGTAHAPVITQTASAVGLEDTRIAVNLNLGTFKADESLTGLTVTGQSGSDAANASALAGSTFTLGTGASVGHYDATSHAWSFTATEVQSIQTSGLYVQTPTNWSDYTSASHTAGLQLTATLASKEIDPETSTVTTASTPLNVSVEVKAVADMPTAMTTSPAHGSEYDGTHADWIPLTISTPALTDTDGSETLSVTIAGVPTGALLNHGTLSSGVWTVAASDLADLKVQPATHNAHDFTLTITATATEGGVASHIDTLTAATSTTLKVTVDGVADTPTIAQTLAAVGNEDTRINLNLNPQLTDSGESLTMTLSGVPTGSHFYSSASGSTAVGPHHPSVSPCPP